MSHPVKACWILKAVAGDEKAFDRLVEVTEYNLAQGAFSIWPCECQPPCPPATKEQISALDTRIFKKIAERKKLAESVRAKA